MSKEKFLNELVKDNSGWKQPCSVKALTSWSLGLVLLTTTIVMSFTWSGFRNGAFAELFSSFQFALEVVLGSVLTVYALWVAVKVSQPGQLAPVQLRAAKRRLALLIALLASLLIFSLYSPSLSPSMVGKRPQCLIEVIVYGLLSFSALAFWGFRRRATLFPGLLGVSIGLFSALLPAVLMHLGCMYEPVHVLKLHFLPALLPIAASVLYWRWRSVKEQKLP